MISIITACYNSYDEIFNTYLSIKSQTYDNWEWIVTDDSSDDDTLELLLDIEKNDSRVRVYQNEANLGAAISRNNSINKATGDFIAFIDSDDLWVKEKLAKQISFMENENIDFSFTAYDLVDVNGINLGVKVDSMQTGAFTYEDMLKKKATLGCSTVMLRRSAFYDVSMPLLRTGQDYATWLKLLKVTDAFILPEVLTHYRIRPNSISRNKFKKALRQWEIYRSVECLSFLKSIYCFAFYSWRAVFRK